MNKYLFICAIFSMFMIVSACTANTDPAKLSQDITQIVEVEIIIPEKLDVNTEHDLSVHVIQGEEDVTDATDVQFEIWKVNSSETGELIEANHLSNGIYSISHAFDEDGIYYIQSHVTARGLHVMPTRQIMVGEISKEELEMLEKDTNNQDGANHHTHNH
jgi:hypothetical protein